MKLTLYPGRSYDEIVVVDALERFVIPHQVIDHQTIEVGDVYQNASVIFVDYPKTLTGDQRRSYKNALIAGNEFVSL